MIQGSVRIGQSYFRKVKDDYGNWRQAWWREIFQNSQDAPGCRIIQATISRDGDNTLIVVRNDGEPMSREILLDKLLAIGETGKAFDGHNVGGFGIAKSLIYYTHLRYEIRTGNLLLTGSGGDYTLEEVDHFFDGTESRVWMAGDEVSEMDRYARNQIFMTNWGRGIFYLNGKLRKGEFANGTKRREFEWAKVYTNKSWSDVLLVRIHGIPMFTRGISCNGRCVVVELKKGNADVLQSNRDSLKWQYREQLDAFIDEITVNKRSALRDTTPKYYHWDGEKLRNSVNQRSQQAVANMTAVIQEAYATIDQPQEEEEVAVAAPADVVAQNVIHRPQVVAESVPEYVEMPKPVRKSKISTEFVLKNELGMVVPDHYMPASFSSYSLKVLRIWTKTLLKIYEVFKKEDTFTVGFILSADHEGEFEDGDYGKTYFLNPIVVVKQQSSASRSLSKRYKLTPAGRWQILAIAAHEFVHGAMGISPHDENYARALTDVLGVLLRERQQFNVCFR